MMKYTWFWIILRILAVLLAVVNAGVNAAVVPALGITANGQRTALTVAAGTKVTVTLTLQNAPATSADWWLLYTSSTQPNKLFSLNLNSGWTVGLMPTYTGKLTDAMFATPVKLVDTVLPVGDYVFLFGADLTPDGQVSSANLVYDIVSVRVSNASSSAVPAELVGTWSDYYSNTYHFNADGTFSFSSIDVPTPCLAWKRMENYQYGTFQISGNTYVEQVTGGQTKTWYCGYDTAYAPNESTQNPPQNRTFTWSISGNKLTLNDGRGSAYSSIIFTKQ
jgi:hypothetical protein